MKEPSQRLPWPYQGRISLSYKVLNLSKRTKDRQVTSGSPPAPAAHPASQGYSCSLVDEAMPPGLSGAGSASGLTLELSVGDHNGLSVTHVRCFSPSVAPLPPAAVWLPFPRLRAGLSSPGVWKGRMQE